MSTPSRPRSTAGSCRSRAFDDHGMMIDAALAQPGEADPAIRKLFANPSRDSCRRPQRHSRLLRGAHREELKMTVAYAKPVMMPGIDNEQAWAAFERRDRRWDGRVIGAVRTTGIYCKPSCPARRPKREHVEFFADGEAARAAGYRACLRCKPDEVGRDREAVARAAQLIEQAEEPPRLDELADGGRLCAAPFPAPVHPRHGRVAGGLCARPAGRAGAAASRGRTRA